MKVDNGAGRLSVAKNTHKRGLTMSNWQNALALDNLRDYIIFQATDDSAEAQDEVSWQLALNPGQRATEYLVEVYADVRDTDPIRAMLYNSHLRTAGDADREGSPIAEVWVMGTMLHIRGKDPAFNEEQKLDALPGLASEDATERNEWATAWIIPAAGLESRIDWLLDKLGSDYRSVQQAAIWSLGLLREVRAVSPLVDLLSSQDPLTISYTARAFQRIKDDRGVPKLIDALDCEDWDVRCQAARALGAIQSPRAVQRLLASLTEPYSLLRAMAARSLGQIGAEEAVSQLLSASTSDDDFNRMAAAQALCRIGDPEAISVLKGRIRRRSGFLPPTEPASWVREAIKKAIRQ